jgi:hypothetical protein
MCVLFLWCWLPQKHGTKLVYAERSLAVKGLIGRLDNLVALGRAVYLVMGICNDETYLCIVHYRVYRLLCVLTRDVVVSHSDVYAADLNDRYRYIMGLLK